MIVRVKDGATNGSDLGSINTAPDIWYNDSISFTAPKGVTEARIMFCHPIGNRPLRMDNVNVADENASPPSFIDSATPK